MSDLNRAGLKRHEFFSDLLEVIKKTLADNEVGQNASEIAANTLVDHLADYWGGQNLSIPKDYLWKLSMLELEIYNQFRGNNYDVLAQKYNMTDRGMRKLINRVHAKLQRRGQNDLFDPTSVNG